MYTVWGHCAQYGDIVHSMGTLCTVWGHCAQFGDIMLYIYLEKNILIKQVKHMTPHLYFHANIVTRLNSNPTAKPYKTPQPLQ